MKTTDKEFESIRALFDKLEADRKEILAKKTEAIIELFQDGGYPEVAERIRKQGLPTSIMIKEGRYQDLKFLREICPIYIKPWSSPTDAEDVMMYWLIKDEVTPVHERIMSINIANE